MYCCINDDCELINCEICWYYAMKFIYNHLFLKVKFNIEFVNDNVVKEQVCIFQ